MFTFGWSNKEMGGHINFTLNRRANLDTDRTYNISRHGQNTAHEGVVLPVTGWFAVVLPGGITVHVVVGEIL